MDIQDSYSDSQFPLMSERMAWKLDRPQGPVFWSNALNHFEMLSGVSVFLYVAAYIGIVMELVEPHLRRKTKNWRQPLEPRVNLAIEL